MEEFITKKLNQARLFLAAKSGNVKKMTELIKADADPYELDKSGKNPFNYITRANPPDLLDKEFVKTLTRFTYTYSKRRGQK